MILLSISRLTCALIFLQIGGKIRTAVQQLGNSCIDLVTEAGNLQCNPNDTYAKRDLNERARKVLENVRKRFSKLMPISMD